uniref:Uncharacterized protein n=1 Tax=Oryza nivara TaxID=4536 RepID=A0A679BAD0_ORYNI|nr:hypothetical protein [Oryza sativa f. spontanea]BBF89858.1 hypothetical protein [Oryza sativa f. spontanea]
MKEQIDRVLWQCRDDCIRGPLLMCTQLDNPVNPFGCLHGNDIYKRDKEEELQQIQPTNDSLRRWWRRTCCLGRIRSNAAVAAAGRIRAAVAAADWIRAAFAAASRFHGAATAAADHIRVAATTADRIRVTTVISASPALSQIASASPPPSPTSIPHQQEENGKNPT